MSTDPGNIPHRRPLFIGPGTVIALVVIAVLFFIQRVNLRQPTPQPGAPSNATLPSGQELGPTPDVSFFVDNSKALNLTSTQVASLKKLEAEAAGKQSQLDGLLRGSKRDQGSSKKETGATISAVDPEFVKIYRRKREVTDAYWKRGLALLTDEQKAKIQNLRKGNYQELIRSLGAGGQSQ